MKNLVLLFVFLLAMYSFTFAQPPYPGCPDVTCAPGWTSASTDWVCIVIGINPTEGPICCWMKICYCYQFNNPDEAHFEIKKIITQNPYCFSSVYFDANLFKKGMLEQLIDDTHLLPGVPGGGIIPPCDPNNPLLYYFVELISAACYQMAFCPPYIEYSLNGCGEGKCYEEYELCWDMTQRPPFLNCVKTSQNQIGPCNIGVSWCPDVHLFGSCITMCQP